MEFRLLYWLQGLHSEYSDVIFRNISALGNKGLVWIIPALLMLFNKKWRKCSAMMLFALFASFIVGNCLLKNIVMRPRPCWTDPSVELLIKCPKDYSFPSGHSYSSFSAATSIFCFNRKAGTAALILASLIAFSRLYLFVHFPTDVISGMMLGIITGVVSSLLINKLSDSRKTQI
ncbi:MAG: phosphatase PAP2 family protein [Oscillospiraceae bacterium]|nr:phosphatase PAP2 family protein [Oscillospiraceae bacterium]